MNRARSGPIGTTPVSKVTLRRIARREFDAAFGLNRCLLDVGGKTKFGVLPFRVELCVDAFEAFAAHLEVGDLYVGG